VRRAWLLGAALLAAGCNVPIARIDELALEPGPPPTEALGPVEGRVCRLWVLGVPFGLPRIDEAARTALAERAGGRVLRDVLVTSEHPVWGPIGRHCYLVEGTAWH
jgi:hypothetical protein